LNDGKDGGDRARVDGGEESARADRGEREPLRAAGDEVGVDATRGYLRKRVTVAAALGILLALRELHAAFRAVVAVGFFGVVAELLLAWHASLLCVRDGSTGARATRVPAIVRMSLFVF
jgi:hypothetical protein